MARAARWAEATVALRHVQSPLEGSAAKLEGHLRGAAVGHLQEMSLRDATLFCKRLSTEELTSYASCLAQLARSPPPISAAKAVASASLPQVEMFEPSDLAKVASALCRLDHFEGAWQLYVWRGCNAVPQGSQDSRICGEPCCG